MGDENCGGELKPRDSEGQISNGERLTKLKLRKSWILQLVIGSIAKDLFADLQGEEAWRIIDPSLCSG
jgi:hypothetical protein